MFGDIYVITNLINGKQYVGQSKALRGGYLYRWSQHVNDSKKTSRQSAISSAIAKYGVENFKIDLIERRVFKHELDCIKWLNSTEISYIKKLNSFEDGYNCSIGGEALRERRTGSDNHKSKAVLMYSLDGLFINSYESITSASISNNIQQASISLCCRRKICSAGDYIWRFGVKSELIAQEDINSARVAKFSRIGYPVKQFSMDGKFIAEYKNANEAKVHSGADPSTIKDCCRSKNGTANGFIWMRAGEEYNLDKSKLDSIKKTYNGKFGIPVDMYSTMGDFLETFNSAHNAYCKTGISASTILRCCNKKKSSKTAGGFIWCYSGEYNSINFSKGHLEPMRCTKKIYVYKEDGSFVRSFDSGVQAERITGIPKRTISRYIIRGLSMPDGNIWKYN